MSVAPLAIFISLATRTFTTFFVRDRLGIDVAATPGFAASHQVSLWGLARSAETVGSCPLFSGWFWWKKKGKKETTSGFECLFFVPFFLIQIILVRNFWVGCIVFGEKPNPKNPLVGWSYVFTAARLPFWTNKVPKLHFWQKSSFRHPKLHPEVLQDPYIHLEGIPNYET